MAENQLPVAVLDAEIALLARLGVDFKFGVELGQHVTLEGLVRGFDAVLVTVGELAAGGWRASWVCRWREIQSRPIRTPARRRWSKVFAAGSAVRPQKQLVKAMAEGRAAAECVHRFLGGQPARRPEKPFSSLMGRLDPGELKAFIRSTHSGGSVSPCDRCAGHTRQEAAVESSRCLHCDCRSLGQLRAAALRADVWREREPLPGGTADRLNSSFSRAESSSNRASASCAASV